MMNKTIIIFLILICSACLTTRSYSAFRDPTAPPAEFSAQAADSSSLYKLDAILVSSDRKLAVINGENKQIGDIVLNERIVAIGDNTVQLDGPYGKMTLFLLGKTIKNLPKITRPKGQREVNPCTDARKELCY